MNNFPAFLSNLDFSMEIARIATNPNCPASLPEPSQVDNGEWSELQVLASKIIQQKSFNTNQTQSPFPTPSHSQQQPQFLLQTEFQSQICFAVFPRMRLCNSIQTMENVEQPITLFEESSNVPKALPNISQNSNIKKELPHKENPYAWGNDVRRAVGIGGFGAKRIPTECLVCSKMSLYNYYGVKCCESCKQFFRRSVVLQNNFPCLRSGQCRVNGRVEKCRGCRMDKCLLVGMDPRLIGVRNNSNNHESLKRFIAKLEKRRTILIGLDETHDKTNLK